MKPTRIALDAVESDSLEILHKNASGRFPNEFLDQTGRKRTAAGSFSIDKRN